MHLTCSHSRQAVFEHWIIISSGFAGFLSMQICRNSYLSISIGSLCSFSTSLYREFLGCYIECLPPEVLILNSPALIVFII